MDKNVRPIAAIEETVTGLHGAAQIGKGVTMWCRGKRVLERRDAGDAEATWRPMTMDDVRALHAAGAIGDDVVDRMHTRLLI